MGNLRHYLRGISSGDSYFTLEKKLSFIIYCLAGFHTLLAVLCCLAEVYPLMAYSAFSVALFLVICVRMTKDGHFATSTLIVASEVMICSLFSTLCLGINCGFSLYNIAIISAFFYLTFVIEPFKKRESISFLLSLLAVVCFVLNYVITQFVTPFYTLYSPVWQHIFYGVNMFVTFLMIISFNYLFIWEIKLNQKTLAAQNKQLDIMAHQDPLTHLLNRRCMNEQLNESLRNLKIKGKRFSLVLCDIDDFKKVNDTYGHDAGDLILITVAQTISQNVRTEDAVCRWGGEEILILINDPVETASTMAERIRKKIQETSTNFEGHTIHITMTFGIAESIPGYRIEQIIQLADEKLYQGKRNGKNRVVI